MLRILLVLVIDVRTIPTVAAFHHECRSDAHDYDYEYEHEHEHDYEHEHE